MKRRTFIAASLGTMGASVFAAWPAHDQIHTGAALAFGTTITVALVHADARPARLAISDALAAALSISTSDIAAQAAARGKQGKAIGEAVQAARAHAVADWLAQAA